MSEFDKAVKHVKTCLFWDFVDGQWLEKLYTPLDRDFFNWLMQGVVETHQAENAKLREALRAAWKCVHAGISCSDCRLIAGGCTLQTAMDELGIEVD